MPSKSPLVTDAKPVTRNVVRRFKLPASEVDCFLVLIDESCPENIAVLSEVRKDLTMFVICARRQNAVAPQVSRLI